MFRLAVVIALFASVACAQPQNALTPEEKAAGWVLLFDGRSTAGWREVTGLPFPDTWRIEDSCLRALNPGHGFQDLRTDIEPDSFEFRFEWKIEPGGNSGVKYLVQKADRWTNAEGLQARARGLEYQLVDNTSPDAVEQTKRCGSLYGVIAPTQAAAHAPGQFNQSALMVRGGHVEHWLNGVKVVAFETSDPVVHAAIVDLGKGALSARRSFISLQNHGTPVWFRNLKLRLLK
jgi:hypothetical protein